MYIHAHTCTIMYMTISYFRNNLKQCLDQALLGEAVELERGGVTYTIKASVKVEGTGGVTERRAATPLKAPEPEIIYDDMPLKVPTVVGRPPVPVIPGLTTADKIAVNGRCRVHGLPLDNRKKCLQKGCKYS